MIQHTEMNEPIFNTTNFHPQQNVVGVMRKVSLLYTSLSAYFFGFSLSSSIPYTKSASFEHFSLAYLLACMHGGWQKGIFGLAFTLASSQSSYLVSFIADGWMTPHGVFIIIIFQCRYMWFHMAITTGF